ncbi:MAG: restriction endonuclease [Planctomycetes bacterium]|jgi:hypothetical protein|nr:restriction endonuclease [Planctomycetota bacterium]
MRILRETTLFRRLRSEIDPLIEAALGDIRQAVLAVDWPQGSGTFTIFPELKGNGVKPIKANFVSYLRDRGWLLEYQENITGEKHPGPIDAAKLIDGGRYIALEWETGNISSSHRALNKMVIGIQKKRLVGGALILPSRKLYKYLTDRIGNYQEIEPYFPVWQNIQIEEGLLIAMEVEHDTTSSTVPRIPKGTDGWARYQRPRR